MTTLLQERLEKVFSHAQAQVLSEVITERYNELVKASDFNELKGIVKELAESHKKTEQKVAELAEAQKRTDLKVAELAEAQKRTDLKVAELAKAQERTEQKVAELAEAQKRTDLKVAELAKAQERTEQKVAELAEAQKRTEETMKLGFQKLSDQISALGSRWGLKNEKMLRNTLHNLLKDLGYSVSRGSYGGREIDILIRNGEHILLEVTSAAVKKDVRNLNLSAEDYYVKNQVEPRLVLAAIYIPPVVMREIVDSPRKIEVYSGDEDDEAIFT